MVGTVGRTSAKVRWPVGKRTTGATCKPQVEKFTRVRARLDTQEWRRDSHLARRPASVEEGRTQWAWGDEAEGVRQVDATASDGRWTSVRNFLPRWRGSALAMPGGRYL